MNKPFFLFFRAHGSYLFVQLFVGHLSACLDRLHEKQWQYCVAVTRISALAWGTSRAARLALTSSVPL